MTVFNFGKKSLIFPLILLICLILFQENPLSRGAVIAAGEAQAAAVSLQREVSGAARKYLFLLGLREENEALKKEKAEMALRHQIFQELQSENRRLRAMLDFPPRPGLKLLPAQVIARDMLSQNSLIVINKGSSHGVEKRMGVLHPQGAVGYVFRVTPGSSQVITLFNKLASLPAVSQRSRASGLVESGGRAGLRFKYFHLESYQEGALAEGDKIVTAPSDQFPPGLPVGFIHYLPKDSHLKADFLKAGESSAIVRPRMSFSSLEEVFVVMNPRGETPGGEL